jgi:hypothetical protein
MKKLRAFSIDDIKLEVGFDPFEARETAFSIEVKKFIKILKKASSGHSFVITKEAMTKVYAASRAIDKKVSGRTIENNLIRVFVL